MKLWHYFQCGFKITKFSGSQVKIGKNKCPFNCFFFFVGQTFRIGPILARETSTFTRQFFRKSRSRQNFMNFSMPKKYPEIVLQFN